MAVPPLFRDWRRLRHGRSLVRFHAASAYIRDRYAELKAQALTESQARWPVAERNILAKPGWILDRPATLESVRLTLLDSTPDKSRLVNARRRARRLMPHGYRGYADVLIEVAGRSHLFNGAVYRPLSIDIVADRLEIVLTMGRYFDHLDTAMVLTHEAALTSLSGARRILGGQYRRYVGDPFDLTRRAAGLGVNTLTIRKGPDGCGFYMHRRNGQWVAEGTEAIHTVPAGEFAPTGHGVNRDDLNIWHTIMREYAEEFLDRPEDAQPIDYMRQSPFAELDEARRSGGLAVHVLGVGLDPLTWKPGLLTVCVFEAAVFDSIFAGTVVNGREGTILAGPAGHGISFDADSVRRYADHPNIYGAGGGLLRLAWQHRAALAIDCPAIP